MAGKKNIVGDAVDAAMRLITGGAEKTPTFKMPPIRPSTDNLSDVGYSNFDHFEFGGDKMLPIENLNGGVSLSDPSQRKRVDALKSAISNPDTGYISRLVVDQDGNVIEGQHRLEALRESGATEAPVSILRDKTAGIDVPKLKAAITSQGGIHSDHVNQLVDMLMDADQYDPPPGFEKFWDAGLKELGSQKGRTGYGGGGFIDDMVKMAGKIVSGADEPAKTGIKAYQGSPHNFAAERLVRFPDKTEQYIVGTPDVLPDVPEGAEVIQDFPLGRMRMDKIGTGEGAQAYGHGLYAAEAEDVAQGYRQRLANVDASEADKIGIPPNYWNAFTMFAKQADETQAEAAARDFANWTGLDFTPDLVRAFDNTLKSRGRMYEVNIAADPNTFLDWDKPLSEQPEAVRRLAGWTPEAEAEYRKASTSDTDALLAALEGESQYVPAKMPQPPGSILPFSATGDELHQKLFHQARRELEGKGASRAYSARVAEKLREAGIPGIKYLDAGSRGAGDGTRNYVVFDDKLISIIRKYGIAGASAMLGYNLMEQLDPKQALAASMADQDFQSSRPQRSMGGNNSISGALNVARGLHGGM